MVFCLRSIESTVALAETTVDTFWQEHNARISSMERFATSLKCIQKTCFNDKNTNANRTAYSINHEMNKFAFICVLYPAQLASTQS